MFWHSIVTGLKVFTFWETYAAAIIFIVVAVLPKFFLALLADRFRFGDYPLSPTLLWLLLRYHFYFGFHELSDKVLEGKMAGGIRGMLVLGFCELLGIYVFVLTLSPIMLGLSNHAAWSLPWMILFYNPLTALKLFGLLVTSTIALGFAPFARNFEPLRHLVLGGTALAFE
jgi:hypothetical protein